MRSKIWTILTVLLVFGMLVAACGGAAEPAPAAAEPTAAPVVEAAPTEAPVVEAAPTEAPAPEAPAATLRVWADDTRAPILQDLAADFQATYGVELVVELKSAIRDDFQVAAPVGEGPDIIVIAHDQAGTLVENGLLAPVDLGDMARRCSWQTPWMPAPSTASSTVCPMPQRTWPSSTTPIWLKTAPTTWDEVISVGEALMADGQTTYVMAATGSTYDMYPLFTAFGGYIFGKDDAGNWDPQDLGVDNEGMIEAVALLADLVAKGDIPADWDWGNNHALFETAEAPFIMAGPWALDRIRESGVPYAVTNFPAGPAGEGFPFAGTQGFFINGLSDNVLLAQAFLTEFVATDEVMQALYEAGGRPSAFLPVLNATDDADLAALGAAGANATMMPAIPAMGSVWANWDERRLCWLVTASRPPKSPWPMPASRSAA